MLPITYKKQILLVTNARAFLGLLQMLKPKSLHHYLFRVEKIEKYLL